MHDSHPKRRTRPCVYYQQGICNRLNCNFSHDISITLSSNSDSTSPLPGSVSTPSVQSQLGEEQDRGVLRSRPCRYFAKGRCTAGDSCRWSHDEEAFLEDGVIHPSAYEDPEYVAPGFKLVPKSYRTLPCARFEKGHCMYGDACTFIHSTPAASSAPTPSARDPRELDSLGPSPPGILIKPHSHHPSPIRPHLPSPSLSTNGHHPTSPLATTSITANSTSLPLAQTMSRELPPPSSQPQFSGTNWAISTPSQQPPAGTLAIGRTSTPVFASSPLLNSLGNEWSHPQPSPLHQSVSSTSQIQQQSRSPFLFTFGEIAPPPKDGPSNLSAIGAQQRQESPAPKSLGLGLNGASLATQGAIGLGSSLSSNGIMVPNGSASNPTNAAGAPLSVANLISSRAGLPISSTSSPAIGLRRSLHGTGMGGGPGSDIGVSVARRLMGGGAGHSRVPSYDTDEPDFPSISYNEFTVDGEAERDDLASVGAGSVGAGSGVGLKLGSTGGTLYGGNGDESGEGHASIQRWAGHGRVASLSGGSVGRPTRFGPGGAYGDLNGYDDQNYRISYKTRPCKFFVAGSRCPSGQQCTFIHDPTALRHGPAPGGPGFGPPPGVFGPPGMLAITNPEQHPLYRTRECKYHLAGHCHQEGTCAFKHTGPAGQGREYENWEGFSLQIRDFENDDDRGPYRARLCKWYLKGNCFHGDNCTYLHNADYIRPPCMFWKNGTGNCLNGDNCRFSHDLVDENEEQRLHSPPQDGLGDFRPANLANGYAYVNKPNGSSSYTNPMDPVHHQQHVLPKVTTVDFSDLNGADDYDDRPAANFSNSLLVDERGRMELVVSEGEDDDDDDDVIVMKTTIDDNGGDKPFERLFSTLSVSAPGTALSR